MAHEFNKGHFDACKKSLGLGSDGVITEDQYQDYMNKKHGPVFKIGNHLIEAYKGYYEDERIVQQDDGSFKLVIDFSMEEWERWIHWKITADSPKERLERYLEWNGIIGYSSTVFDIATGKL